MQVLLQTFKWLFSATVPAGRLFGIPLRVHLIMLIFLPFFAWSLSRGMDFGFGLAYAAVYIGILYISVLAHEFGHAWGCRLVGGETQQIILTPIGGLHMGTGGIESPRTELIVVALGPAVSILFSLIGWGLTALTADMALTSQWAIFGWIAIRVFFAVNLMLTLFNLLFPLFPMDSARLIRAAFALKYNPQLVTLRVCQFGLGLSIVVLFAGLIGIELPFLGRVGIFLMLIAILGIQVSVAEQQRIQYMPVYTHSDDWGNGPVYYDKEIIAFAGQRALADIARLLFIKPGSTRPKTPKSKKKKRGPAEIIEVVPLTDPEKVSDRVKLQAMMQEAVAREDFDMAARVKKRLEEIHTETQR